MKSSTIKILGLLFIGLIAVSWLLLPKQEAQTVQSSLEYSDMLSAKNETFAQVFKPRTFVFPQDHGAHPEYRIEWWYFTGNIQSKSNRKFGYELTFFRFALTPDQINTASAWRDNQMYMAHFALTDAKENKFYVDERSSRAGNGLAGAESDNYHVWLHDWKAEAIDGNNSNIYLSAKTDDFSIALQLQAQKKIALQGVDGLSQKSPQPGNASYYYSYTRMATSGQIEIKQRAFEVTGSSWMDREWSSSSLSKEQSGWDWFSLQLSDNSELMFYQLRRKDGNLSQNSSGAIFHADGSKTSLNLSELEIKVLDQWKSPHSQIIYPAKWQLLIPKLGLELIIVPLINDQELNVRYRYWEGAVQVTGTKLGQAVSGQGYVELTGYHLKPAIAKEKIQ